MFDGNMCETREQVNSVAAKERVARLDLRKESSKLNTVLSFRQNLEN